MPMEMKSINITNLSENELCLKIVHNIITYELQKKTIF